MAQGLVAIAPLGERWVAEEALAIAVYCSLVAQDDFARGVRLAVNHSGDSDSTDNYLREQRADWQEIVDCSMRSVAGASIVKKQEATECISG